MSSLKAKIAAVATFAAATGTALIMAGSAFAVTVPAPAITGDPNAANGSLTFYDATGNVVTSGTNLTQLFTYAAASSPGRTGATRATVFFAFPDHTQADSQNWFSSQATTPAAFPSATNPAPLTGPGFTNPVGKALAGDANLAAMLPTTIQDTTAGFAGILQVRLFDSGPGVPILSTPFWATDIFYDAAANTWQQVFPAVATTTTTTTTLTANPNPSTVGNTVTLTAQVTPATAAGTVQFVDGTTNIGTPVPVTTGTATTTTSTLTAGSHSLSAVFVPTDTAAFSGSTGTFTATVNPASTPTSTTLAISGGYLTAGSPATLTATVTPAAAPGTVAFFDNGSATPLAGTVTSATPGTYVLDVPAGFVAGGHSIVAKFTPANVANFQVSQSAPQSFLTQAATVGACAQPGSVCTDPQNIQATIGVGTLVINTPYTAASPLNLGTLTLDATGQQYSGTAAFSNIVVTDQRTGNLPWTVSALASNLSDGGANPNSVINAQNVGLTGISATGGPGFTGTITSTSNPAASPAVGPTAAGSAGLGGATPHTVASTGTTSGRGTATMSGTLTLNAPTSTEAGLFAGTVTFTVG